MTDSPYLGRLAPSPTGALHLGNIRTFMITWLHCRVNRGQLAMRMEDLNIERLKDGAIESIYEDLIWLGFDWDIGAGLHYLDSSKKEDETYIQSNSMELYHNTFMYLQKEKLIYPCSCTRKEIAQIQSAPHDNHEQHYKNTCRDRWNNETEARAHKGHPISWRFKINHQIDSFNDGFYNHYAYPLDQWSGDFIIAQSSEKVAYQLAVVIDDARHKVTQVIRADDLLNSTLRQLTLYRELNYSTPNFTHLPLMIGPDGIRLAKRHGDFKISSLRKKGVPAKRIIGYLAHTCGWTKSSKEISLNELLPLFDLSSIPRKEIVVDPNLEKLLY